jgi:hypothetical protein
MSSFVRSGHDRLSIQTEGPGGLPATFKPCKNLIDIAGAMAPAMRTRLQQMGGALEIRSSSATKHRGATLCAVIPHALTLKRSRLRERRQRDLVIAYPFNTSIKSGGTRKMLRGI